MKPPNELRFSWRPYVRNTDPLVPYMHVFGNARFGAFSGQSPNVTGSGSECLPARAGSVLPGRNEVQAATKRF